jgi:hypothetical protein
MIIDNEYENAFPYEKEYTDWISCLEMEMDYVEPPKLVVTNQTRILLDSDEYSPYSTVNS